jgi:hypothetical protein
MRHRNASWVSIVEIDCPEHSKLITSAAKNSGVTQERCAMSCSLLDCPDTSGQVRRAPILERSARVDPPELCVAVAVKFLGTSIESGVRSSGTGLETCCRVLRA